MFVLFVLSDEKGETGSRPVQKEKKYNAPDKSKALH